MRGMIVAPAVLAAVLAAGSACAQQRIDQRRPTGATGVVEIHNLAGTVRVVGWNRNEVAVTGTLGRGAERLELASEGDRMVVRVVLPRRAHNVRASDIEVRVPARKTVNVHTVSAGIEVHGVTGAVDANAVSGDVRVTGDAGEVSVNAVSGAVEIGSVSGRAEVSTVSGNMRVTGRRLHGSFSTVSGNIVVSGDLARDGKTAFNTHSGDVELLLARGSSASVDVSTFSGAIEAQVPDSRIDRSTSRELRMRIGRGDSRISIRTFSGDVTLGSR